MKIAMVIDYLDSNSGGIVSTRRFISALRKKGHKVYIIASGKKRKDMLQLKKIYVPFVKKIMKEMDFVFAKYNEKSIKKIIEKSDIVHIQLPFYLGIKTLKLAKSLNKKVITSFHVQAENISENLNINSDKLNKRIYSFFINNFYNKSDLVICPSKRADKILKENNIEAKTKIISNGVPSYFKTIKNNKKNENFIILNVGRLSYEKDQMLLIKAISKSKYKDKIELIIKGHGPLYNDIKKAIKEKNINARLIKKVSTKKLIQLYNEADLYVHTSKVELEGMVVLEAMSCSLPIIVRDIESNASKDFALNEKSLFKTEEDLIKKIEFFYENRDFLKKMSSEYRKYANKFSFDKSVKELEKTYKEIIKEKAIS